MQSERSLQIFAPGPLWPTDLLEQEICALAGQESVSLPGNPTVSSQQLWRWSTASLKVQITFWIVGPGTGLYQQVCVWTRGKKEKKSSIKHKEQRRVEGETWCGMLQLFGQMCFQEGNSVLNVNPLRSSVDLGLPVSLCRSFHLE